MPHAAGASAHDPIEREHAAAPELGPRDLALVAAVDSATVFWDLEGDAERIRALGAVHLDHAFRRPSGSREALAELDAFATLAVFSAGHNLLAHDLPALRARAPHLELLGKPVIDTLVLSPLCFPKNPYHRLVKNDLLVRDAAKDPVADARQARRLLHDELVELLKLKAELPALATLLRNGLETVRTEPWPGTDTRADLVTLFDGLGIPAAPVDARALVEGHACENAPLDLHPLPLAYLVAWLRVSGSESIVPAWVRKSFPAVPVAVRRLRATPCGRCAFCRDMHDADAARERFFPSHAAFRPRPAAPDGASLQRRVVEAGLRDESLLAVLPTGAGKSFCYQLPALVRNRRDGSLTVVISPLQALMKDQVESLERKAETSAVGAIHGLLTPLERAQVFERLRSGALAVVFVAPEQLRNRSFGKALEHRQIGAWVFDEAHCLSKWGHDFRPDYLYAARFVRTFSERTHTPIPPIACFTATARKPVIDELVGHFREELGVVLTPYVAQEGRTNLGHSVEAAGRDAKPARILELLATHRIGPGRSAVVFTSTRKGAERLAEQLGAGGFRAVHFHAGLDPSAKREAQDRFMRGEVDVVCATNAFGMGVDKPDVRLVVHADIPGSLESYLQEAGRAGRDGEQAHCVLLWDEQDLEAQFGLAARARLSRRDVAEILRGIRKAGSRRKPGDIVLTTHDIARDDALDLGFDARDASADTKVKTAVAWLERRKFLERNENDTGVFQGKPKLPTLEAAEAQIAKLDLPPHLATVWVRVLRHLATAPPDDGFRADDLAALMEVPAGIRHGRPTTPGQELLRILDQMVQRGLLEEAVLCTAFLRHKVKDGSRDRFEAVAALDRRLVAALRELAPNADTEDFQQLQLRQVAELIRGEGACDQSTVRSLLRSLAEDGRGMASRRGSLDLRYVRFGHYAIRLHQTWDTLAEAAQRRRDAAGLVLELLHRKVADPSERSAALLVSFALSDLALAVRADTAFAGLHADDLDVVVRNALLFLHDQKVITLQHGLAIFRQAMTIRLEPGKKGTRYTKEDYEPLREHYEQQALQIHVMGEYARRGLGAQARADELVADYFRSDDEALRRAHFPERGEDLTRLVDPAQLARIVGLGNEVQERIVTGPAEGDDLLVLAGPGSGKTQVIVHRCAYLLQVLREPAESILVVCFNRSAAHVIRTRLQQLVGDAARRVVVQTYHGLALRLTGRSLVNVSERAAGEPDGKLFEAILAEACELLDGTRPPIAADEDEIRTRVLTGFRHILVDEYQDIDETQYRLLSLVAGKGVADRDERLSILAVGDDDQNIYAFRGSSTKFLEQFQADYEAKRVFLVDNYRSTKAIVAAANELIARNRDRMKTEHPIRARADGPAPAVKILEVPDGAAQAAAVVGELRIARARRRLEGRSVAVLARTHDELSAVRHALEEAGIGVRWTLPRDKKITLPRVREVARLLRWAGSRRNEPADPERLRAEARGQGGNDWRTLCVRTVDRWIEEAGGEAEAAKTPLSDFVDFAYELLAEAGREQSIGAPDGVFLATLHGAKGLEFDEVFLLDGGWRKHGDEGLEEARRLFYVGMTRARTSLVLCERRDDRNPHTPGLVGAEVVRVRFEGAATAGLPRGRWHVLGLKDLFLDYAGRKRRSAREHRALAALACGDEVALRVDGDWVKVCDRRGVAVASLSDAAAREWRPRLGRIARARVLAMVERRREDSGEEFRDRVAVDAWEVPVVEVLET